MMMWRAARYKLKYENELNKLMVETRAENDKNPVTVQYMPYSFGGKENISDANGQMHKSLNPAMTMIIISGATCYWGEKHLTSVLYAIQRFHSQFQGIQHYPM